MIDEKYNEDKTFLNLKGKPNIKQKTRVLGYIILYSERIKKEETKDKLEEISLKVLKHNRKVDGDFTEEIAENYIKEIKDIISKEGGIV